MYSRRDEYTLFIREDRGSRGRETFRRTGGESRRGGEIGIIKGIQGNKVENVLDVVEREKTGLREKVSSQK